MDLDAHHVVNQLLLELVKSPSHRLELRGDHAHPLLIDRLREMAEMPIGEQTGTIGISINGRPWEVAVTIIPGAAGEEVELVAREAMPPAAMPPEAMPPADPLKGRQIGRVLTKMGKITEMQLVEALNLQKRTGGPLGQILISLGYINESDLNAALAAQRGEAR
jgi:hypothetical protein